MERYVGITYLAIYNSELRNTMEDLFLVASTADNLNLLV